MIATIRMAILNWQNNTCLIFNELTSITTTTNRSYIRFERDDEYGCSSPVGYDPTDPTSTILLASGCGQVKFFTLAQRFRVLSNVFVRFSEL